MEGQPESQRVQAQALEADELMHALDAESKSLFPLK
jgi:hypothetical protein